MTSKLHHRLVGAALTEKMLQIIQETQQIHSFVMTVLYTHAIQQEHLHLIQMIVAVEEDTHGTVMAVERVQIHGKLR